MLEALHAAREAAAGHEAVCVSHQLPIWVLRRYVERKRLWHDPRTRQCGLASLTSTTGSSGSRTPNRPPTWSRCPRAPGRPRGPDAVPARRTWLLASATALALAAGVIVYAAWSEPDWRQRCATTADGWLRCAADARPAPPRVAGELLAGGRYDVAAERGKVVVVNFWGSWCAPCRAEADDLEATFQATRARGVAFVGINIKDDRDRAIAFERGRVTYPSLFDHGARLALEFDLPPNATPSTIILDRQGRIARVTHGAVRRTSLEPMVAEVAAEPAGPR
jgi:thiol-disulfide isomerase/thioredoxin